MMHPLAIFVWSCDRFHSRKQGEMGYGISLAERKVVHIDFTCDIVLMDTTSIHLRKKTELQKWHNWGYVLIARNAK